MDAKTRQVTIIHAICPCGDGRPRDCSRHHPRRPAFVPRWLERGRVAGDMGRDETGRVLNP